MFTPYSYPNLCTDHRAAATAPSLSPTSFPLTPERPPATRRRLCDTCSTLNHDASRTLAVSVDIVPLAALPAQTRPQGPADKNTMDQIWGSGAALFHVD